MEYKAEKITPYGRQESKTEQVRDMFDSIAPAYDFMNRAMTFCIDKIWRRIAVGKLYRYGAKRILDVATGTGDLAMLLGRKLHPEEVVGVDLSEGMLEVARGKASAAGMANLKFEVGDCMALNYGDCMFDAVTVAYGVRNFEHIEQGYREICRVLKPGGVLCVIELSTPKNPFVHALYKIYTRYLIPIVGRLVSKDVRAYSYLPESIAAAPQREDMTSLMQRAGFRDCRYYSLTFGVCTIYLAEK